MVFHDPYLHLISWDCVKNNSHSWSAETLLFHDIKTLLWHFSLNFQWRSKHLLSSFCYQPYQNIQNAWSSFACSMLLCHIETLDSAHTLDAADHNCTSYSSTFSRRIYWPLKSISGANSYSKAGNKESQGWWSGRLKDVSGAAAVYICNINGTYACLSAVLIQVSVPPCAFPPCCHPLHNPCPHLDAHGCHGKEANCRVATAV